MANTRRPIPLKAMLTWFERSGIDGGVVFRKVNRRRRQGVRLSDSSVAQLVKRVCKAAALKPLKLSGHSVRAGLVTSAAMVRVEKRSF